ncbi:MAG: response regulator [Pseudomonadota bacterium]
MDNVKKTVMLVDDDPDVAWALGRRFTRSGFAVTACGDGEEARTILETRGFDFVLTDIRMPRMGGLALIEWICLNRPSTRVIVMTAFASPEMRRYCLRRGAIYFLEKPVDPELLMDIMNSSDVSNSFTGNIAEIDILDYLQLTILSGKRTVLEIVGHDGARGCVFVDKGEILHATCGSCEGEEALYRCLCSSGGSFATLPWRDPERATINKPGDFVLFEAARRRDEIRDVTNRPPAQ